LRASRIVSSRRSSYSRISSVALSYGVLGMALSF
jgi:hypothetical protein